MYNSEDIDIVFLNFNSTIQLNHVTSTTNLQCQQVKSLKPNLLHQILENSKPRLRLVCLQWSLQPTRHPPVLSRPPDLICKGTQTLGARELLQHKRHSVAFSLSDFRTARVALFPIRCPLFSLRRKRRRTIPVLLLRLHPHYHQRISLRLLITALLPHLHLRLQLRPLRLLHPPRLRSRKRAARNPKATSSASEI